MSKILMKRESKQQKLEDLITQEHRDAVVQWVAEGNTHKGVMLLLKGNHGIEIKQVETFTKHFINEIEQGHAMLETTLQNTIYKKAIAGDNASLFFALKTKFGWRETARFNIDQAKEAKAQLEQIIEGTASGNLQAAEARSIAAIVELKEKATKGNLGESQAPNVVVTPFTQEDFDEVATKDDNNDTTTE